MADRVIFVKHRYGDGISDVEDGRERKMAVPDEISIDKNLAGQSRRKNKPKKKNDKVFFFFFVLCFRTKERETTHR